MDWCGSDHVMSWGGGVRMYAQVHQQASSASSAALEKKQEEVRGRRPAYDVMSGESQATDCLP